MSPPGAKSMLLDVRTLCSDLCSRPIPRLHGNRCGPVTAKHAVPQHIRRHTKPAAPQQLRRISIKPVASQQLQRRRQPGVPLRPCDRGWGCSRGKVAHRTASNAGVYACSTLEHPLCGRCDTTPPCVGSCDPNEIQIVSLAGSSHSPTCASTCFTAFFKRLPG